MFKTKRATTVKSRDRSVLVFSIMFFAVMPFSKAIAGELNDNDPNIIAICNCVENEQTAKSSNCQNLFAEMFPEKQNRNSQSPRVPASHIVQPPIQGPTGSR